MKKQNLIKLAFSAMIIVSLVSCDKDEEIKSPISKVNTADSGSLVSNSNLIDLRKFVASSTKSALEDERQKVVLTLTNENDTVINELTSVIEFEANFDLDIEMDFEELQPGESMDVTFYYTCLETEPGEYTGVAKLIPNVGEEIVVELKATVVASADEADTATLSTKSIDFGTFNSSYLKSSSTDEPTEEPIDAPTVEPTVVIVTLTNTTEEQITGASVTAHFPGELEFEWLTQPILEPGESADIKFTFTPIGFKFPGEYLGTATITPDGGEAIVVELKAIIEASDIEKATPAFQLDKSFVDFGDVKANGETPEEVTVKITNRSEEVISDITTDVDFVGTTSVEYIGAKELKPGESAELKIKFTATDLTPGTHWGSIEIISDVDHSIINLITSVVE